MDVEKTHVILKTCAQCIPVGMSICYVKHKGKRFGEIICSASEAFCKSVYSNEYYVLIMCDYMN